MTPELVLNILTTSSILLLVALGLAIVFGLMNILNMAHGELVTIGAFTVSLVQAFGGNFWLGVFAAAVVGALFGLALERGLIRYLYDRPLGVILVTWGVSLIIQQGLLLGFGPSPQLVIAPVEGTFDLFGVNYPSYRLILIAAAIVVTLSAALLLTRTRFGLDLRTVIQNREVAEILGIDTRRVFMIAFAGASAIASLAGALIAPMSKIVPTMGAEYLAPSFFVVIVGGTGSLPGAVAGSGLIGGLRTVLDYQIPSTLSQALVLIVAVIIVRFRPRGLVPA
ncbi:branched-chain amino acid ABC transporter permease [Microbaculum marinisediminis]|uniref:Branched-chain amino acid ABC transporter permease n=1 Tax=Microbaculum marinisediminis TaxID=2931392 RepID=A0AAW5QXZ9_9HYPH|nr:branched-chain amino acid ABC transporter permease [Microbaculum sp. A6E488]MCT8972936.1 branched-chain amino acid ABC transporter permease [Microbaculum sp. A6E488]